MDGVDGQTFVLPMYLVQNFPDTKRQTKHRISLYEMKDGKYPYRALAGCQCVVAQLGGGGGPQSLVNQMHFDSEAIGWSQESPLHKRTQF